MTGYLFDTNVLSETRKPRPHGGVVAWVESLVPEQIFVCSFSLGEIQWGIEKTRANSPGRAEELEAWVDGVIGTNKVLPMDSACFREWGRLVKGKADQLQYDAIIAAAAKVNGLTVATRNTRHFERFAVPVYNPFEFTGSVREVS